MIVYTRLYLIPNVIMINSFIFKDFPNMRVKFTIILHFAVLISWAFHLQGPNPALSIAVLQLD
jgi:hypothetical protein